MDGDDPKPGSLAYSRQDLRKATRFVEGDYSGINPRRFYRSLKRSLEEIQDEDGFKYTTFGNQDSDLQIEGEEVGAKTGTVKGRLVAASDQKDIGTAELNYRPYGPHGAGALVAGALLLVIGLAGPVSVAFLGVLGILGGGYLYMQTDVGEVPISRQDIIRTLVTGEVSEHTYEEGGEKRTEMISNMSVVYAADSLMEVSYSGLEDLPWSLRHKLKNQVNRWYNEVMGPDAPSADIEEGFVGYLNAWSDRSVEAVRGEIARRQKKLTEEFRTRVEYTDILAEYLPEVEDELSDLQDQLLQELEELSEDMEIYVEREGITTA